MVSGAHRHSCMQGQPHNLHWQTLVVGMFRSPVCALAAPHCRMLAKSLDCTKSWSEGFIVL
jgi:hypothetical protein